MFAAGVGRVVVGYIRVSQVGARRGERFISPVVQREAIERWAAARGAHLLDVFTELDESGARADRPQLAAALRCVDAGAADGMVVWKVSRFSRSVLDGLSVIEQVRAIGGAFFSVYEGFDTTTEAGRLMLRFMLAMAETDLEHLRNGYATAQIKMVERGGYSAAYPPVGYTRTRSNRLRPDSRTGPLVTQLFRLRAEGWSRIRLCRWLEANHVPTAKGNAGWVDSTLANLLRNRVYLGEVSWSGHVRENAHLPLTDPVTWDQAQRPRQPTAHWSRKPALLAGLVRCASCSMIMSPDARRDAQTGRPRRYGCRGRSASGRCPGAASMSNDYLEPYVELAAIELLRRRRRAPEAALRAAETALATVERDLADYRDNSRLHRVLGDADFAAGIEVRALRAREARAHVARERARHSIHALPPTPRIEASWPGLPIDEKRRIIEAVIDCVFVRPGRLDLEQRITICPRGTAPARLPRAGDKGGQAKPFTPRRGTPQSTSGRSPYLWSHARVARELRPHLRDRRNWPTQAEFHAAGASRLHLNIVLGEGERWWAYRFGLHLPEQITRAPWTDERIHKLLDLYLADKTNWPSLGQFERDGLYALRQAIITSGGVKRWQAQFPEVGPVQKRSRVDGWTPDRVREQLHNVLTEPVFPTRRAFYRADQEALYYAVRKYGGIKYWASEFGLPTATEARRARQTAPAAEEATAE